MGPHYDWHSMVGRPTSDDDAAQEERQKKLLEYLITVADIRDDSSSSLHAVFAETSKSGMQSGDQQDVVLVDHNAPQVSGVSSDDLSSRFNLTGVIDHHVEENIVQTPASPRIVKTGIGSCCSLVVQHLRDAQLWPTPSSSTDTTEPVLARLALAPILIDTANLHATEDKISDMDRASVAFLESHITPSDPAWDRDAFYTTIQQAKSDKLRLLTMDEIFESDYKEWTERPSSSPPDTKPLTIGVASLVNDLHWLVGHAGSAGKLTAAMHDFARRGSRDLEILALITKGNAPDGAFRKELAVLAHGDVARRALERFEREAGELDLKEWKEDGEFLDAMGTSAKGEHGGEGNMAYRVWWQGDVSKSRKQVAPLLREAVKGA